MAAAKLATRVAELEKEVSALAGEVARLKAKDANGVRGDEWIERIYGAFADDSDYDKAMELGRQYRESLRPKSRAKRTVKTARH